MNPVTKDGIDNYVRIGQPPGDFLYAVLTNNLRESFGKADLENRRDMFDIVSYCWNSIPAICWGSPEKVRMWMYNKQAKQEEAAKEPKE